MAITLAAGPRPDWSVARLALVSVLLIQVAGLALTVARDGTPLNTWSFVHAGWSEQAAIRFDQLGIFLTVMGVLVATLAQRGPPRLLGGAIASAWFALLAMAEWRVGGAAFTQLAVAAHASRIAAPLVLVLWDRPNALRWVLRAAVASTFAVHGFEALSLHPMFIDYLLAADLRIFGLALDERTAGSILRVIGAVDILVAALVLTGRDLRAVLAWAAAWGTITALSRIVLGGEPALHQTLIRAANGGLPLVLLLLSSGRTMNVRSSAAARELSRALPLLLAIVPVLAGAQSLTGAGPGHLRLVWTEDPAHRATISWSTMSAGTEHQVLFDTVSRGRALNAYASRATASTGQYQSGAPWYHHAEVSGLKPATTYYFVVVSDGIASPERHFVTSHTDDRPFRLLFGGDSRSGVADRRRMNQRIARLAESDPGIIAFAHGGDYIDLAWAWSEWSSWLEDHALTFTSDGRVLPIIPTKGNHEVDGQVFNRVFGFPGGPTVDYFVTRLGEHATFITLDTNVSAGGDQRVWLEQRLQEAQSGRWIIPSYHIPAFPAVKTPGAALQFWVPLFEQYNVDVVCESDGHVLKRTVPVRAGKPDPTGIVYVGEGGLGVPQRTPVAAWYLEPPGMAKSAHHVQIFSFSPEKLVYEARLMDGTVEDRYEFRPRRTPAMSTPPPQAAEPPAFTAVAARSPTQVAVTYSTDMDSATTGVPAAYQIAPDAQVTDVAMESARTFVLSTKPLSPDVEYLLTASGVRSAAGASPSEPLLATFVVSERVDVIDGGSPLEDPAPLGPPPATTQGCGCGAGGGALAWAGLVLFGLASRLSMRRRD